MPLPTPDRGPALTTPTAILHGDDDCGFGSLDEVQRVKFDQNGPQATGVSSERPCGPVERSARAPPPLPKRRGSRIAGTDV